MFLAALNHYFVKFQQFLFLVVAIIGLQGQLVSALKCQMTRVATMLASSGRGCAALSHTSKLKQPLRTGIDFILLLCCTMT